MKNIFIILFFFLITISLFSNDMAIKLLENSYKQLNKNLLECQVEEKRLDVPKSNLADHLTLRSKIEELEKRRADLRTMLDQLIENYEKTSKKDSNGKDDNSTSAGEKQTGDTSKPPKEEKPKDTQAGTGKNTPDAKGNKPDKKSPAKALKAKEKPKIIFSSKIVKPGSKFVYTVVPPKHYLNPKIVWIKCSSNLNTITGAPMTKSMRGYLVADSLITRAQNASVTVFLRDLATPRQYGQATAGIVISAYTEERKIGLKIPSRMLSGRTYNFLIIVPPDFKRPLSIHVKSLAGRHVIVSSNSTSLAGSMKVWGNGKPDVILSGSISAQVYDDSGKIGYVRKSFVIDEPTQEELDKIPMEQPPTWYEEVASAAWKATKTGLKTTGQVMQALADAEAQHGYLKNVSKPNNSYSPPKTPAPKHKIKPPPKPHWTTKKKAQAPKTYKVNIKCTHPSYLAPGWAGAHLGSFTVTKVPSVEYSMILPIKSAPLKSSRIISGILYIKKSSRNMAEIKRVKAKFEIVYSQYLKGKVWARYNKALKTRVNKQISRSRFGPFIIN